jgi:hypothetical protein
VFGGGVSSLVELSRRRRTVGVEECGVGGGRRQGTGPGRLRPDAASEAASVTRVASGAASGSDAGGVREHGVPFITFSSASSGCVQILRAAWCLPPRWSSGFLPFLPRCGAVISTIYTFISFLSTQIRHFLRSPILPRVFRTFFFFLSRYSPASTRLPVRSRTLFTPSLPSVESRFPPEAETPLGPITVGVSLRRPIGAEPAFPARGMLAQFTHAFVGGALLALVGTLRSCHSLPGRGAGGVVALTLHTQTKFTEGQM